MHSKNQKNTYVLFFFLSVFCFVNTSHAKEKIFREIKITGLKNIQKEDLKPLLQPFVGKPFKIAQQQELQGKLASISMLEFASFKLGYQQTLQLYVKERTPYAMTVFQEKWYIDAKGILFAWFGSSSPPEITEIKGNWSTKTQMFENRHVFKEAIVLMRALQNVLQQSAETLFWDATLGWSFVLQRDLPYFYIGKEPFEAKLQRVSAVMDDIMSQKDKIFRIDCNFRDRIVLKLRPDIDS